MPTKGIVIIYTGDGKGKTTAALGQAIRAAGHGFKVCIIQFIKGTWLTGEMQSLKLFKDKIELHTTGTGFTWEADTMDDVKSAALKAWELTQKKIADATYDMVILDELTYLITHGIVNEKNVLTVINNRPGTQHIVITGRDATPALIAAADLVTEMRLVKHPFAKGVKAGKGIEF